MKLALASHGYPVLPSAPARPFSSEWIYKVVEEANSV